MPPPCGGDLRVGGAAEPAAQLVAPIAGEHRMRVGVDEARHDREAAPVDDAASGADASEAGISASGPAKRIRSPSAATAPSWTIGRSR